MCLLADDRCGRDALLRLQALIGLVAPQPWIESAPSRGEHKLSRDAVSRRLCAA